MLAIFAYTSGYESWRDSSNWMTSRLHEEWFGVELHASTNRIITLNLGNNQLAGTIPTELGELTDLTRLHLTINSLTGTIPTELGELTALDFLNLASNDLFGPIPTELGELTDLTGLDLTMNTLTGPIPSQLGKLIALNTFRLQEDNNLSADLPPFEVCELVQSLGASNTDITTCLE